MILQDSRNVMAGFCDSLLQPVPLPVCGLCRSEVQATSYWRGSSKRTTSNGMVANLWTSSTASIASTAQLRRELWGSRLTQTSSNVVDGCSRTSGNSRYLLFVRALQSRENRRQERGRSPGDYAPPANRNSSPGGPPTRDSEEDGLDELPSLFRGRRRDSSPPAAENGAGGGGGGGGGDGGGWGLFSQNRKGPNASSEVPASPSGWSPYNKFVLAGLFVVGMGAGIALDTVVNVEPSNVASREVIDRQTPNPDVCIANGMSAMVLDQRLFITFSPFNVYVSQAEVKPGCVLQQANWRVLESRGLVNAEEVRDCKRNFNTFGFVGDLRQAPEITCVYHSENAENQFLKDPSKAALGDGFQPRDFKEP